MKLTQRNYFSKKSNLEYMSVSQWKAMYKCPASALAEIKGKYKRETTSALLVGSYVDSYFENTLDKFKKDNPEIFKKDGSLKAEYIQAETIIQRIEKDKLFMEYMSGLIYDVMRYNYYPFRLLANEFDLNNDIASDFFPNSSPLHIMK